MNTGLLILLSAIMAPGWPSIRVDHDDKSTNRMLCPVITLGPQTSSGQPLYVAFEDDSMNGIVVIRADIMFQKSTDGGRTWLPTDVLIRRGSPGATYPDIATDPDGNIYIAYSNSDSTRTQCDCVRSSDGGATWSAPISNNMSTWSQITVDSGGNLVEAWTDGHVYSSVSTDKGLTWSPRVRVDDDTVSDDCWQVDAFVQPGTNQYLVVAAAPYWSGEIIVHGCYFYRSTDMGRTFQSGVRLDTFGGVTCQPHVVADAQHVICDYTGSSHNSEQINTGARTLYTGPDTWGCPVPITELDTPRWSYYNGAKLAISADGRVHTALMIHEPFNDNNLTYYSSSLDHGVTWSELERVNDDSMADCWDQDVAADSDGHAYIVWQNNPFVRGELWFATNNPLAVAEQPTKRKPGSALGVEPNPFTNKATLILSARAKGSAVMRVYAQDGRLVRQARIPAGEARWVWDGRDDSGAPLPPGVYVIEADQGVRAKVVKLK